MVISCRHYVSLATDAREGSLSAWNRARVAMHRTVCSYCQAFDSQMKTTLDLLHDQPVEPPNEGMEAALLEKLRAAHKSREPR